METCDDPDRMEDPPKKKANRRKGSETSAALLKATEGKTKDAFFDCAAEKILPPSNAIWTELSQAVPFTMSPKNVYVCFNEDRWGITTQVRKQLGLPCLAPKRPLPREKEDDVFVCGKSQTKETSPQETFIVRIPPDDWQKMKPCKTNYNRKDRASGKRTVWVLPPYVWTGVLANLLWEQHHIPCPYVWKRAEVNLVPDLNHKYVTIKQLRCNECGAEASAYIDTAPEENMPAILHLKATNTISVPHENKRYCFRPERENIGQQIDTKSVSEFRRKEAKSKVVDGVSAPHLYSTAVYRNIKQNEQQKKYEKLGIPKGEPIQTLLDMKRSGPFIGSIHLVAADPVIVMYHSPSQLQVNNSLCEAGYTRFHVDATGSCAERIPRGTSYSRKLLLYQVTGETGEGTVPIMQLISERQDAALITFWFNDAIRQKMRVGNEYACDDSKALLSALCRAMAGCSSTKDYKEKCFRFLSGALTNLPKCFIRNDAAHFLNNAAKWKFWKRESTRPLVKTHLMRWLGILMKSSTRNEFFSRLSLILTVTNAETTGLNAQRKPTPASEARDALNKLVSGREAETIERISLAADGEDDDDMDEDEDEADREEETVPDIKTAVQDVAILAMEHAAEEGDDVNPYYHKSFANKVIEISYDFVLWSGVMVIPFKSPYATGVSAGVEGYFNEVKHQIFKEEELPIALHKFVGLHLSSILGHVAIASTTPVLKKSLLVPSESDTCTDSGEELGYEENWRGVADAEKRGWENNIKSTKDVVIEKKSEKEVSEKESEGTKSAELNNEQRSKNCSKYLNSHPSIEVETLDVLSPPRDYLLRNGSVTGFYEIHEGSRVQVRNTGAFDSVAQVMAVGVLEHPLFRQEVNKLKEECPALQVVWALAHQGAVKETYALRAKALVASGYTELKKVNTVSSTRNSLNRKARRTDIMSYDSFGTLVDTIKGLKLNLKSAQIQWSCPKKHLTTTYRLTLDVSSTTLLSGGFSDLPSSVMNHSDTDERICHEKRCQRRSTGTSDYGNAIFIDTGFLQNPKTVAPSKYSKQYALEEMPSSIQLREKDYSLVGLVAHEPNHFVAYGRRQRGTWEVYDDCHHRPRTERGSRLMTPQLLFYVAAPV